MQWTETTLPWDQRLARLLVRPLASTRLSPNVITTVSLVLGLVAGGLYARGGNLSDWAALLLVFAIFIDHADGELARMTGRTSVYGHYYDNITGAIILVAAFVGMGFGLRDGAYGDWSLIMGVSAGVSIAITFGTILHVGGQDSLVQPNIAGFEIEDSLYLTAPITWLGWQDVFLLLAVVGSPIYLIYVLWRFRHSDIQSLKRNDHK